MQHGDARDAPDRSQADRPARRFVDGQLQEAGVLADSHGDPPDRLVLTTLTNCDGNVALTWRQLTNLGWRTRSLSAFRRRATRLLATHPVPLLARRDTKPPARAPRPDTPRSHPTATGDVLVVAIDVCDRDVISSWVVPNPSRKGTTLAGRVREALALRSHLMLDLSEYAASNKGAR